MEVRRRLSQEQERESTHATMDAIKSLGFSRRELKIQGTVGGNADNRLNYVSLASQVSEAKGKGHSESEIAYALRRAVAAGSELRQYLDSLDGDISLDVVLGCIRRAYKEKAASELFQDLNNLCQMPEEDNQTFIFRALGLKQKMIAASKVETAVKYDVALIQSVFKRSVSTGLRSETVRSHMKPFLQTTREVPDHELIGELSKIAAEETERETKQIGSACSRRRVQINEVSVNKVEMEKVIKPLTDTIQELSDQLKAMQSELGAMKQRRSERQQRKTSWKPKGCLDCVSKKLFCKHCWKCGGDGHIATNCQSSN